MKWYNVSQKICNSKSSIDQHLNNLISCIFPVSGNAYVQKFVVGGCQRFIPPLLQRFFPEQSSTKLTTRITWTIFLYSTYCCNTGLSLYWAVIVSTSDLFNSRRSGFSSHLVSLLDTLRKWPLSEISPSSLQRFSNGIFFKYRAYFCHN